LVSYHASGGGAVAIPAVSRISNNVNGYLRFRLACFWASAEAAGVAACALGRFCRCVAVWAPAAAVSVRCAVACTVVAPFAAR